MDYKQRELVSDKLKDIQANAMWTQEKLARELDVPVKTISSWITDKANPRCENLEKIDKLYNYIVGRRNIDPGLLLSTEQMAPTRRLDARELYENQELRAKIIANLTYHTDAIEGSTMTLEDVTTVLESDRAVLGDVSAREQVEALNHRTAFNYLLEELYKQGDSFKWTEQIILNTHLRLQNSLLTSAGTYRQYTVRVTGSSRARANYMSVPKLMVELVSDLNKETPEPELIDKLARTHAQFELIHPFGDGNGRAGRLIMFIEALRHGAVPPLVLRERKRSYYRCLDIANVRDEYNLLRMFIAESILDTDKLLSEPLDY